MSVGWYLSWAFQDEQSIRVTSGVEVRKGMEPDPVWARQSSRAERVSSSWEAHGVAVGAQAGRQEAGAGVSAHRHTPGPPGYSVGSGKPGILKFMQRRDRVVSTP